MLGGATRIVVDHCKCGEAGPGEGVIQTELAQYLLTLRHRYSGLTDVHVSVVPGNHTCRFVAKIVPI